MSCKSALYGANTSEQALAVDGVISFGNIIRRFGNAVLLVAGNIVNTGAGYYDIDANFTFEGTATGTATITLYKDGIAIPGAVISHSTEADTVYNATIPALVRNVCCNESTITAVVTGVAVNVLNASVVVKKV